MSRRIVLGSPVHLGAGGLGYHLDFIRMAARHHGSSVQVYCSDLSDEENGIHRVPPVRGSRYLSYTPIRWTPAYRVLLDSIHFDRHTSKSNFVDANTVYHSFPGFAMATFGAVHKTGGITVLEAATVHARDLYLDVEMEHKRLRMGGAPFSRQWVDRVVKEYDLADYIIVSSLLQKNSLVDRGIHESKIVFAPLGIDTTRYSPVEGQPSLRFREKGEPFRIVQVGQVSLLKGFHYLLEAVKLLARPDVEVVFVGGIGWRKIRTLMETYRAAGMKIKVIAGDPVPYLRTAHVCVHSTLSDGFGLAPLEAMSTGLPVVATDRTGMKDIIRNGENGFVVERRNVQQLADVLHSLINDDRARTKVASLSRRSALQYERTERVVRYIHEVRHIWR